MFYTSTARASDDEAQPPRECFCRPNIYQGERAIRGGQPAVTSTSSHLNDESSEIPRIEECRMCGLTDGGPCRLRSVNARITGAGSTPRSSARSCHRCLRATLIRATCDHQQKSCQELIVLQASTRTSLRSACAHVPRDERNQFISTRTGRRHASHLRLEQNSFAHDPHLSTMPGRATTSRDRPAPSLRYETCASSQERQRHRYRYADRAARVRAPMSMPCSSTRLRHGRVQRPAAHGPAMDASGFGGARPIMAASTPGLHVQRARSC